MNEEIVKEFIEVLKEMTKPNYIIIIISAFGGVILGFFLNWLFQRGETKRLNKKLFDKSQIDGLVNTIKLLISYINSDNIEVKKKSQDTINGLEAESVLYKLSGNNLVSDVKQLINLIYEYNRIVDNPLGYKSDTNTSDKIGSNKEEENKRKEIEDKCIEITKNIRSNFIS